MADDDPDSTPWSDRIVGARMAVDSEFSDEVERSAFSRQEWGLVMTAVDFDIVNADDESAELVADTEHLEEVLPELERARETQAAMGAGRQPDDGGGGFVDNLKNALGLGGSDAEEIDEEQLREARQLVDAYAAELQAHLEAEGRWEEIRTAYHEQQ
ncbi:MAG: DUF5799 family protein [Haloglomus sp.]